MEKRGSCLSWHLCFQRNMDACRSCGWSQTSRVPGTSPTDARCSGVIASRILFHSPQDSGLLNNRVSRRRPDKLLLAVNSQGRTARGAEL